MRKVFVECEAIDCLHHTKHGLSCDVTEDSFINIASDGSCLDYTPLTSDELRIIVSKKR